MSNQTGSRITSALERMWSIFQEYEPGIPDVVICIGTHPRAKTGSTWSGDRPQDGWQVAGNRTGEVIIAAHDLSGNHDPETPEYAVCNRNVDHVVCLLAHEFVHAYNAYNDYVDTSRQGRYHNRVFWRSHKRLFGTGSANECGDHPFLPSYRRTMLAESIFTYQVGPFNEIYNELREALKAERVSVPQRATTSSSGYIPVRCNCGRLIRVSPSTFSRGDIVCHVCNHTFEHERPPRQIQYFNQNAARAAETNQRLSLERIAELEQQIANQQPAVNLGAEHYFEQGFNQSVEGTPQNDGNRWTQIAEDFGPDLATAQSDVLRLALEFETTRDRETFAALANAIKTLARAQNGPTETPPTTPEPIDRFTMLELDDSPQTSTSNPNAAANAAAAAAALSTSSAVTSGLERDLQTALNADGSQNSELVDALRNCADCVADLFASGDTWHRYRLNDAWTMAGGVIATATTITTLAGRFSQGEDTPLMRQQAQWILRKCQQQFSLQYSDILETLEG